MAKIEPRFLEDLSSIYVTQTEVGAPSGVASLDGSGKIPVSQLPNSVMEFKGSWNPSTNSPTLIDGTGNTGDVYWVTVAFAGPIAGLSNPSMINFQIGDLVIYNGTNWELTTPAAGVSSVNGAQGAVTVNAINQLSGDGTTTAASGSQSKVFTLTATTNSTLTSLPALVSAPVLAGVGTITSGIWNGTATKGQAQLGAGTTYTTPAGITIRTVFKFILVGGGGGGGGSNTANGCGCGGGGGGVGILFITGLTPSTAYAISIGARGIQGTTAPTAGGDGGDTTLTIGATTYTAFGGKGGAGAINTRAGGLGGSTANCTLSLPGQNGMGTGSASVTNTNSSGGSTGLGYGLGGQGSVAFIGIDGYFATGYGGGGAGAGPGVGFGGFGAQGALFIEWNN